MALFLAVLGLWACTSTTPESADVTTSSPWKEVNGLSEAENETADRPLRASLRAVGPAEVVPKHVLIRFNKRLYENVAVDAEPAGVLYTVTPDVVGEMRVRASDLLEFTPTEGFLPDVNYSFTVESVQVEDASIPGDDAWTTTFQTPPFQLVRAALHARSKNREMATISLVFSGPVEAGAVAEKLAVEIEGVPERPVSVSQGEDHTVLVSLRIEYANNVDITLNEGVPSFQNERVLAGKKTLKVPLPKGPEMRIENATPKESAEGWFIEVVCDDDASDGERYWYDREIGDSWWLSQRCLLNEAWAHQVIHTEPDTEISVANGPGGFRIFGDFSRGDLKLAIDAGATTADGGVLYQSFENTYTVPGRTPTVSFTSKGRYLPRSAWKNLGIQHLNVDKVGLEIRHVPRENLVFWLTGDEPLTDRTSNVVLSTKLAVPNTVDSVEASWVPVQDLVSEAGNGIYELTVTAGNHRDQARLMLTDMQLIAKAAHPGPSGSWSPQIQAWATDVHSGEGLEGVRIKLVRASGQSMAECTTRGDKGCTLEPGEAEYDHSAPVALIATRGDDLTYIKMSDLILDKPSDTSGRPYSLAQPLQSPLYTDRGVYRPGRPSRRQRAVSPWW